MSTKTTLSKILKVSPASIKRSEATKLRLQKLLVAKLTKKFPDHIKDVLQRDVEYVILNAAFEKTRFGEIICITVASDSNSDIKYRTYFTGLVTNRVLELFKDENVRTHRGDVLEGVTFIYRNEITSDKGNTYSDIDFTGVISLENKEEEIEEGEIVDDEA